MTSCGGWSIDSPKWWPASWLWRLICWPVGRKPFCDRMFEVSKLMEELAPASELAPEVWFPQSAEICSPTVSFNDISGQIWSIGCPFRAQCNELSPFFWSKGEIEFGVVMWCSWVAAIAPPHQKNTTTTNNAAEKSLVIIKRERFYKTNLKLYGISSRSYQNSQH